MTCRLAVCALLLVAGTVRADESQKSAVDGVDHCPCGAGLCTKCSHEDDAACAGCEKSLMALDTSCESGECAKGDGQCAGCAKSCGTKAFGKCNKSRVAGETAVAFDDDVLPASSLTFNLASANPEATATAGVWTLASPALVSDQELLQQKLAQRDQLQHEIDELCESTQSWQQVVVRVKVMEVNLTKMRKLGLDFQQFGANGFQVSTTEPCAGKCGSEKCSAEKCSSDKCTAHKTCTEKTSAEKCTCEKTGAAKCCSTACADGQCSDSKCCADKSSCQACSHCSGGDGFASFIQALEQRNIAKTLASPTVVTVSGRPASIHVGGQVPVPTNPGSTSACDYLDFGTKLDLLAVVQGGNRVQLEIRSSISEICDDRSLVVAGNSIPSLRTNRYDTGCELEFGQTVALSGLVQQRVESVKTEDGVREETCEVMQVLIVTPEVVTSVARQLSVVK